MIYYNVLEKMLKEKTGLAYKSPNSKNLICKCPWCELDSKKNHGHLYIELSDNPSIIPFFHCFKCEDKNNSRGTLIKLLKYLKEDIIKYISSDTIKNCKIRINKNEYYKKDFQVSNYKLPEVETNSYILKRQYLHSRLGFEYNLNRIPNLILNVREFIQENNIDLGERKKFLDFYENSFVGFVSNRGTILSLRNIDPNSDFRFSKIDLIKNTPFYKDFYGIKTARPKTGMNTIVLSEGIFDILVGMDVFELEEIRKKSCLWACVFGSGFYNIIPSVLDYCKLTIANFIILADIDKKDSNFSILRKYSPFVNNLDVYWNKFGKDFGKQPIYPVRAI